MGAEITNVISATFNWGVWGLPNHEDFSISIPSVQPESEPQTASLNIVSNLVRFSLTDLMSIRSWESI